MRAKEKAIIHNSLGGQDKGKHVGNKPTIFCPDYTILKNRGKL